MQQVGVDMGGGGGSAFRPFEPPPTGPIRLMALSNQHKHTSNGAKGSICKIAQWRLHPLTCLAEPLAHYFNL